MSGRGPVIAVLAFAATVAEGAAVRLDVGGATLSVTVPDGGTNATPAEITRWVSDAAAAVTAFYGRFPVPRVAIDVARVDGARIGGTTYMGRRIAMRLGADVTAADLQHDWTMTHEMFHLGFPDLDDRHLWMEEGLSDYLEPLARARLGQLGVDDVWRGFLKGMPRGAPQDGDRGLDFTRTWAATYWGGALFWLLADVEVRERTHGASSIDVAIRAILDAGGDGRAHWPIEQVLRVGDEATGTTVLRDLYARMGREAAPMDLATLWDRLGVRLVGADVVFDDRAPLAAVRRALTRSGHERNASAGGREGGPAPGHAGPPDSSTSMGERWRTSSTSRP